MIKKEKKVVNLAEEITQIKTDEPTILVDSKTKTKAAPKKAAKKTKTEKEEKSTSKKSAATPLKNKDANKTTKASTKVEKIESIEQVYFQYAGNELSSQAILEQVKQLWEASGNKISAIKTLNLYIKPEDNAAYYVINDTETGKVEL